MERRFSKRAKRHAAESKQRTKRMLKSRRPGPVTVSYLPGFGPPPTPTLTKYGETKFPFYATINGRRAIVRLEGGKIMFDYVRPA